MNFAQRVSIRRFEPTASLRNSQSKVLSRKSAHRASIQDHRASTQDHRVPTQAHRASIQRLKASLSLRNFQLKGLSGHSPEDVVRATLVVQNFSLQRPRANHLPPIHGVDGDVHDRAKICQQKGSFRETGPKQRRTGPVFSHHRCSGEREDGSWPQTGSKGALFRKLGGWNALFPAGPEGF